MPAVEPLANLLTRGASEANPKGEAPFEVICAWPVSGQYGPGARILYYVLVAICVLARRAEWLRNACLAAALLLPLVAALHGIVLAVVHKDHAVDLDVYGAFQLCAIGVLVAPVAATLSRTYFKNPGRNAIVLWSLLVVAGLISLSVEFYRVSTQHTDCWFDNEQRPLNKNMSFPYENAHCGLICSAGTPGSPVSKIRGGSADNIYVVPVPYVLTFNVCIMLTAALCIPAILLLVWMLVTTSHTNWTRRFGEHASLTLKVPVKVFDAETGLPSLQDLQDYSRVGVIETTAYTAKMQSIAHPRPSGAFGNDAEHVECAVVSEAESSDHSLRSGGISTLLHDLQAKSALSVHDFEVNGKPMQIREVKLADDLENFAKHLYAALRDLETENVDLICVQSIEAEEGTREANAMKWLLNEERLEKEVPSRRRSRTEEARTPGVMILLGLSSLAVVALLVIGERNLFSPPVNYQTEPMANIGQWSPVAGTILVVAGSIYVLIAEAMRKERQRMRADDNSHSHDPVASIVGRATRKFIRELIKLNDFFDAPRSLFDNSDFIKAQNTYPLAPGEEDRNPNVEQTREQYAPSKRSSESGRSAATRNSFAVSTASRRRYTASSNPDTAPDAIHLARMDTLDLPGAGFSTRHRRWTHGSAPSTQQQPIILHNAAEQPTITVSPVEDETPANDVAC